MATIVESILISIFRLSMDRSSPSTTLDHQDPMGHAYLLAEE